MTLSYSPLAEKVPGVRDPKLAALRKPWGYLLHTTGSGVLDQAKKRKITPLAYALKVYIDSQNGSNGYKWGGPQYVIDHDGKIYQIAPDEAKTAHAGGPHRPLYLNGGWLNKVSPETVRRWQAKWPGRKHPYSLFPSMSPNDDYIGAEMIPVGMGYGGAPMRPGLRFTKAQHDSAIALGKELGTRHGWPTGWVNTSRLLGHEDVDPIERSIISGGWDPGWLRENPYFDFKYVREEMMK